MQPVSRTAAPPPAPPAAGTIGAALQTKAAPPPTMRGVVKPLPPRQPEEPETIEGQAVDTEATEPATTEAAIPQDMNALFSNLMKAG